MCISLLDMMLALDISVGFGIGQEAGVLSQTRERQNSRVSWNFHARSGPVSFSSAHVLYQLPLVAPTLFDPNEAC